ncbi:MAG: hypothetical protein WBZ19_25000, partial [Chthoniobacterales bacterium]
MKAVVPPPETSATSAITHLSPKTAKNGGPNTAKRLNISRSHPSAPIMVTTKKRLVGYLIRPDTTKRAVRVPRTSRLKMSANPPNLVNHLEA